MARDFENGGDYQQNGEKGVKDKIGFAKIGIHQRRDGRMINSKKTDDKNKPEKVTPLEYLESQGVK